MIAVLKKHQKLLAFYGSAFFLPALIMLVVLWSMDIYWGSKTTILASDGFHQYSIFATQLRNILHGSDSFFYTFTSGLGLNFYALSSYYLGSFLSPFYYFFSVKSMADAVYLFTLIKFGLMGVSMSFTLRKLFVNLQEPLIASLSTSYALMSFAVSQLEINTWLDVLILAPLIILGLHYLLEQKRFWLYYLTLTLLFIQNYYFGFMLAIFLALYFLVQLTRNPNWQKLVASFTNFTVVSILSALTSAVMLIPSYLDLSTHGEKFSTFNTLLTDKVWTFDLFAKNFVGAYDTTKFGAIPMIYVGLFPLALALTFFTIKEIKWFVKLAYALLLGVIIASFYLNPLDLLWQGMHAPNMFLHRYAWLFSTLIILMAGESLSYLQKFYVKRLLAVFSLLIIGFTLTFIYARHYTFLKPIHLVLTLAFLIAYAVILVAFNKKQLGSLAMIAFTLVFTLFEIGLNAYYQVNNLNDEWIFPTREGYEQDRSQIDQLIKYTKQQQDTFFRTERLLPQTGNDSMKFNYNGISQFSSIRNTASSSQLDRLGFQSNGTNLNLRYQNNTIIADSLFGVTYNLSNEDVGKYGFKVVKSSGFLSLYRNKNASQLAILTDGVYKDVKFTINTLDNQASLLNNLTRLDQTYFTHLSSQTQDSLTNFNDRLTVIAPAGENTAKLSYQVNVPANQQVYISLPNLSLSNEDANSVTVTVNDKIYNYTTDNAFSFFNLGYFQKESQIKVTLAFPENHQVSFERPNFYGLSTQAYQRAMDKIKSQKVTVTTQNNQVTANYTAKKAGSLFFTLPYDKGWSAKLNGKPVKIRKAQKGFIAVDVPAGKGKVKLSFIPNGFKSASLLSIAGLILFLLYNYSYHHFLKRQTKTSGY